MQSFKLDVEYEGTRFHGWQIQPHKRTIQGELVAAAQTFLQVEVKIAGAGRTDAGVHALNQVAHLKIPDAKRPASCKQIRLGLNSLLPHDINVLNVSPAPLAFHARHDAVSRYYLYQISTRRSAFGKSFLWWIRDKLDVDEMARAWQQISGRHDFRMFADSRDESASTFINVHCADLSIAGDLILLRIGAERFLWKMVRRLVGVVVELARAKAATRKNLPESIFEFDKSAIAAITAPPSGLFLEKILYAGDPTPRKAQPLIQVS